MTKDFLRSDFMILCIGALLVLVYPLLVFPKGELELLINQYHTPWLDSIFKYATHLGDGSLMAVLLVIVLFRNYYSSLVVAFSIILQSVFVSIFKRWIYKGLERPLAFFDGRFDLNFVEGVEVHSSNTFPSGHTVTGFALFALLFILIGNRKFIFALLLFALAMLVGLSRVYLLQHFIVDVYFGAVFGLLSVILALYFMQIFFNPRQVENLRVKSLIATFKKIKAA